LTFTALPKYNLFHSLSSLRFTALLAGSEGSVERTSTGAYFEKAVLP